MTRIDRRAALTGIAGGMLYAMSPGSARAAAEPEETFRAMMSAAGLPGAAAALTVRGRAPLMLSFGAADLAFGVPVTPDTLFHAGSVGKHVTAAILLDLAERGAIALSAPIGRYMRDLPAEWQDIEIEKLLTHTSGIPDYQGGIIWDRPLLRQRVIENEGVHRLVTPPGAAWRYCNLAYTLLGYLIEDVTGTSFAAVVAALFGRAGLSGWRVDDAEAVIALRASPYAAAPDGGWRHAVPMSSSISSVGAGGILMSASQLPRWHDALWGGRLLSAQSIARTMKPFRLNDGSSCGYAMGWFTDRAPDGSPYVYHTGSVSGFRCYHFHSAADGTGMCLLTNVGTDRIGELGISVLEALVPGYTYRNLGVLTDEHSSLTRKTRALLLGQRPPVTADLASGLRLLFAERGDTALRVRDDPETVSSFDVIQEWTEDRLFYRRYRLSTGAGDEFVRVAYDSARAIHTVNWL